MKMQSSSTIFNSRLGKATNIKIDQIMATRSEKDVREHRCKVICTMGPACWDVERLVEMMDAGMNVARLNFSHGDHETHGNTVRNLTAALKQRPGVTVALLLDTKGPEIRTGLLVDGKAINLVAGQPLKISTDYELRGDTTCISCSYQKLPSAVAVGGKILIADGSLTCEVTEIGDNFVTTRCLNGATLGEKKNMNLPGVKVELPCIGEKDKKDILEFGIPHGCNFIAASFVQCAQDVEEIRQILGPRGRHIKIIPKIENVEGIINFNEILNAADGIMVARGDMGMEIPPEKVFLAQKMMISKCNLAGKPVITATQMLESMIKNPRPTRAEVSDVANAVLDGTDAVMLSGESANGGFPVEAVQVLSRVCLEAESCIDYPALYRALHASMPRPLSIQESVCCAAVETAEDVSARIIIALTETGNTARLIAKYRPAQTILALSASDSSAKHLQLTRGIVSLRVNSFQGTDEVIRRAIAQAKEGGFVEVGDTVVCVHGIQEEVAGATNLLKVVEVI